MNIFSKIKAVAFDCDGVMFDTFETNRKFYNTILEKFNRPVMTQDQAEYAHMQTVDRALESLFPELDSLDEIYAFKGALDYYSFIPHMRIEPELKGLLSSLRPRYKTAVATNRKDTMPAVLSHFNLEPLFDEVITTLHVENPKPAPDQLFMLLDLFNMAPLEMVFIGDSILDQQAADSAGVPFIAYGNNALKSDYHIESLARVGQLLNL